MIQASLLTPVSSISTYGKIINSAAKVGREKKETRELLLDLEEEDEKRKQEMKAELAKEPAMPRSVALFTSFKVTNPSKESPCFLAKGKQCDRNAAKGGVEETPDPSHYNPSYRLVKTSAPHISVPRPKTAMSRKLMCGEPKQGSRPSSAASHTSAHKSRRARRDHEGWYSKLHATVCSRPQSAMSATPARTDRLKNGMSPWLKNLQAGQSSAFRSTYRLSLADGPERELVDVANDQLVRPRSACTVNLARTIDRPQRNKHGREGVLCGGYTQTCNYNQNLDNDAPTRKGLKKGPGGEYAPAASCIRMEHQVNRKPFADFEKYEKTPGLQKLGISQAVWGTEAGCAAGTEQVLTSKRTPGLKMDQVEWSKAKQVGHMGVGDENLDVMYNATEALVRPRSKEPVDLYHQKDRKTFGDETPDGGADKIYEWTKFIDKKQVASPNMKSTPDRSMRARQGFGSTDGGQADLMYDHNNIRAALKNRVKGVDVERLTSRAPPAAEPEGYQDQLPCGKALRDIGDLNLSPVFGSSPLVPDMGGKAKRWTHNEKKASQGFHL